MDYADVVLQYHEATKHYPHRYARGPGSMDWATQPDPFRRYHGALCVRLALPEPAESPSYDALYQPGAVTPRPVCRESVSEFLQYSLALSAWKEHQGMRWALRINPSSGNLHPTEGYLALGAVEGLIDVPGVFHYAPRDHLLERRREMTAETWDGLMRGFPTGAFLAGLASIHWRETWKYGERAYRYCQHDVGHALAAMCLSAAVQGWWVHPLSEMCDRDIRDLLGLDHRNDAGEAEPEHPDLVVAVVPLVEASVAALPRRLPEAELSSIASGSWHGHANRLSSSHVPWMRIDAVADACVKLSTASPLPSTPAPALGDSCGADRPPIPARRIIQQRRSAVAMDGRTSIGAETFYRMMDRTLPRFGRPPWTGLGPPALVHLGLFVHRVSGLAPGVYFLARVPERLASLRESMRCEFEWEKPKGCPPTLPLYRLMARDVQTLAGNVSCGQDISADGAFSLGMIAEFEGPLRADGMWMYRRLLWETGAIGQILYLEAETAGVRGTGIGCFFDEAVHEVFGLKGVKFQSLYHFTIGGPIEDTRLTTLAPYGEREQRSDKS